MQNNYMYRFPWHVIIDPRINFKGGLTKSGWS